MAHRASSERNVHSAIQGILRTDLYKHLSFSLVAHLMGASVTVGWRQAVSLNSPVTQNFDQIW